MKKLVYATNHVIKEMVEVYKNPLFWWIFYYPLATVFVLVVLPHFFVQACKRYHPSIWEKKQ